MSIMVAGENEVNTGTGETTHSPRDLGEEARGPCPSQTHLVN